VKCKKLTFCQHGDGRNGREEEQPDHGSKQTPRESLQRDEELLQRHHPQQLGADKQFKSMTVASCVKK
jgi:hypothetical protein